MSETFRSVRPSWIAFGWFIAAAITSVVIVALVVAGLIRTDAPTEGTAVALALAFGFWLAGLFVGTRVNAAPILHGLGIGLFSLVAWAGVNFFLGEPAGVTAWSTLSPQAAAALLLLQTAAAVVGTRMGVRLARRAARD